MRTTILGLGLAATLAAGTVAAETSRPVLTAMDLYRSCSGIGAIVDHCQDYMRGLHNMRNVTLTNDKPLHCRAGAFSSEKLRSAYLAWMDKQVGNREIMELPANTAVWRAWMEMLFVPIGCVKPKE